MDKNFEKDIIKCLDSSINALEIKLTRCLKRYCDNDEKMRVGKPLKYFYYEPKNGFIELRFKYHYSPDEIELLESIKKLPKEKLDIVKEYIAQLSE